MTLAPSIAETAALILIGNELLSGKTAEANMFELARTLRALGVKLQRATVIRDEVSVIANEVLTASHNHDVVFTSGGVGPTHDDVTIEGVAAAFGLVIETDPTMKAMLTQAYGGECTEEHLRMALVPSGAKLYTTADVMWPTVVVRNVWLLPGVPEIFRMKLNVVRAWVRGSRPFVTKAVFTQLDEPALKPLLDAATAAHPGVEIGSYPKWFDASYRTKVTFDSQDERTVDAAVADFVRALPEGEPQRIK